MTNLSQYKGPSQFGKAYHIMYQNDSHAPGSVDRALLEEIVRICPETRDHLYTTFTPLQTHYIQGSRPALERLLPPNATAADIARLTGEMAEQCPPGLDGFLLGGTEEEIAARGTDWCTDLARLGCVLAHMACLPARLAILADTAQAYSGHVIVEIYEGGEWHAVDTTNGIVYPESVAELMDRPDPGQFRAAALVNYGPSDAHRYDYTISTINDYMRPVLEAAIEGWPGGLRWLHGEDNA